MDEDVPIGNTYDKYGSTNPIEQWLMARFFGAFHSALPAQAPTSILEVGMGEGAVAGRVCHRFPDAHFVGVDLPDPELAASWRLCGLTGLVADISRLPFLDDAFDLVLAIEVLEHVPEPRAALRELSRVSSASLVLSVPQEPIWRVANVARGKYLGALGNTPGHLNHWSRRAFVELVGTQFSVGSVATPFPWTVVAAHAR